jgi:hypothetical protein
MTQSKTGRPSIKYAKNQHSRLAESKFFSLTEKPLNDDLKVDAKKNNGRENYFFHAGVLHVSLTKTVTSLLS